MHLLTGIGIKGNTLPLHIKHAEDKKNKPKKKMMKLGKVLAINLRVKCCMEKCRGNSGILLHCECKSDQTAQL